MCLCTFQTLDVGKSCCPLSLSEAGRNVKPSSKSPEVHLETLLHAIFKPFTRDTEKRRSVPLGPGRVLSRESAGLVVKSAGPRHVVRFGKVIALGRREERVPVEQEAVQGGRGSLESGPGLPHRRVCGLEAL